MSFKLTPENVAILARAANPDQLRALRAIQSGTYTQEDARTIACMIARRTDVQAEVTRR